MRYFLTLLLLMVSLSQQAQEFRGAWIATVFNIDWPTVQGTSSKIIERQQKELIKLMDQCDDLNLNAICLQVRSMGDAIYPSHVGEPFSEFLSGARGMDPNWDPLQFAIEQAHARGLALYAWINPFRQSKGSFYDAPSDQQARRDSILLSHGPYTVYNPALPQVRQHIADVVEDIIMNYRVDGIIFDDYFYPNKIPETPQAGDYNLWLREASNVPIGDWRRDNVNKTISLVSQTINRLRPDVRFGISPAGVAGKKDTSAPRHHVEPCPVKAADWQWQEIYSDPLAWLEQGTIDFISPQIYWIQSHPTAPYEPLAQWWSETANKFNRHFYSSHSLSNYKKDLYPTKQELREQVEINRLHAKEKPQGSIFYSAKNLSRLPQDLYAEKSLIPAVDWKKHRKLPKITSLRLRGDKLTWKPLSPQPASRDKQSPDEIIKYAVFKKTPDGEQLLGVTYIPEFMVEEGQELKDFTVRAVDGYGFMRQ